MEKREDVRELRPDQPEPEGAGSVQLGVYQPGFPYKEESLAFFRRRVGEETYARAMRCEAGQRHHYVVARAFLSQADWEKFVWIEQYGTLDGFPG